MNPRALGRLGLGLLAVVGVATGLCWRAGLGPFAPRVPAGEAPPPPVPSTSRVQPADFPPLAQAWQLGEDKAERTWSLPAGCSLRAPPRFAKVPASSRFEALPDTLGTLMVADAEGDPPRLLGASAWALGPRPLAPSTVPWLEASSPPRLARLEGRQPAARAQGVQGVPLGAEVGGSWLGAFTAGGEEGGSLVALWKGGAVEPLALGDGLQAVDLRCSPRGCALLTTRLGAVASPGAELYLGRAEEAAPAWRRVPLRPLSPTGDTRPLGLVRGPGADGLAASLAEGDEVLFYEVDLASSQASSQAPPPLLGRLPARGGVVLDSAAAPRLLALVDASRPDARGCSGDKAALRLEREGKAALDLHAAAPPTSGALRSLTQGALALWQAPTSCGSRQSTLHGVLLDAQGEPREAPIPLRDVESFAVGAVGDEVDLWLQDLQGVTWLELRCSP